jgi:hypothetical protein
MPAVVRPDDPVAGSGAGDQVEQHERSREANAAPVHDEGMTQAVNQIDAILAEGTVQR